MIVHTTGMNHLKTILIFYWIISVLVLEAFKIIRSKFELKNDTFTVKHWFWARAGFEEYQMALCNKRSLLYTDRRHGKLSPFVHGHEMPDFGERVLYNGRYTVLRGVSWLKRCCFMCALLLVTLLCSFVRVTTSGILYQQANYELLKESYVSIFF